MTSAPTAQNISMPPPPEGKYKTIAIDPPWHFETRAKVKDETKTRTPQKHYATMDLDAIKAIDMASVMDKDCNVFLWITGPMLVRGVHNECFDAWGLKPSAMAFTWLKLRKKFDNTKLLRTPLLEADLHCATAFTTMQNQEFCVLGRRGQNSRVARNCRQVIIENVREHSRKPEAFYERAMAYSEGPYLDIFGGRERRSWDYWGIPHWKEKQSCANQPSQI